MKTRLLAIFLLMASPALAQGIEVAAKLYAAQDYKGAIQLAEPLANNGDAGAMAMMGAAYLTGNGVAKNVKKAAEWFTKAADLGHPGAQLSLATLYLDDSLGEPDPELARKWMRSSADGASKVTPSGT